MIDNNKVIEKIHSPIQKVWSEDLSVDYNHSFILKEDSLKNAFYYHLRTRLGDYFLHENNLRIFTEYYIKGERIDLVIVEIDQEKVVENYLGDCVERVLVAIEMKHKNGYTNESIFYQDVEKVLSFINAWGNETKHYLAFIQERYFKIGDVQNWIEDEQVATVKGKVTELYAYWDEDSDETIWSIVDH